MPGLIDVVAALIAMGVAIALGSGVRSWHRKRAVRLRLRVDDETTAVLDENGRPLVQVATAVVLNRKAGSTRFTIELVESAAPLEGREVVRFADPPADPALGPAYNGFVAACCMRARSAIKISGFRAMRVTLENNMSRPAAERFERDVQPKRLVPLGIYFE